LVLKVVGPVHKTDVNGVVLNINALESVTTEFNRLMTIDGATGVLIQQMLAGTELFIGAKYEDGYGHLIMAGLGGIFIEVLKDVSSALTPVSKYEAELMISNLKSKQLFEGVRGIDPISKDEFIDIIQRVSTLVKLAPEIMELDLNPLLATKDGIITVDSRICIKK